MNLDRPDVELFSNLTFIWVVANYLPLGDFDATEARKPVFVSLRSCAVLIASWGISGWAAGWRIAVPLCILTIGLLRLRDRLDKRFLAELELVNLGVLVALGYLIRTFGLVLHPLFRISAPTNAVPASLLIAAIVCYALRGGNYIVRGLLEKGALIPKRVAPEANVSGDFYDLDPGPVPAVDANVRHGRTIGYLERIVIIACIAAGSFEALAFLIAAKGLIRAKEFDERSFAEYFLVGSLCSVLVALIAGTVIRMLLQTIAPGGVIEALR
jgi:hypothetical protein